ncbi:MAG: ThiF family adenylyltransferase [Verrucomicrobiales bacterium]|nr:ThiF family adenylyltransferase [Verrucomicrobiales bacterium]
MKPRFPSNEGEARQPREANGRAGSPAAFVVASQRPRRGERRAVASVAPVVAAPAPRLCVVGLGNIGSQFVDHLARLPGLAHVLLVDRDVYEPANLSAQAVSARDVGRPKAMVQARRLRQLNPQLQVETFAGDLESLPLGRWRGALVAGCLDSLHARQALGERAWRVGSAFLDAGVDPASGLARVTCFLPGPDRPCFACGLDDRDYAALGAVHPCAGPVPVPATNGSFALGGLAAAWLALECERLLRGRPDPSLAGREVLLETRTGRLLVSRRARNPACRFDHRAWTITPFAGLTIDNSLADALRLAGDLVGNHRPFPERLNGKDPGGARLTGKGRMIPRSAEVTFRLPGQRLAKALHCPACGAMVERFQVVDRGGPRTCPHCETGALAVVGFKVVDCVGHHLPAALLRQPLRRVGFRAGDVLAVESGRRTRYLQIPENR